MKDQSAQQKFSNWVISDCNDGHTYAAPVKSFNPNKFGLYDMHGNVWEWVQDRWHDDYEGAPTEGSVWEVGDSTDRVIRGGSWFSWPGNLRSASRNSGRIDQRNEDLGFRPVYVK